MASGKKQIKRRNHTVNKSYLRRFASETGILTRVELPDGTRKSISISNATVRKDFYVLTLPNGTRTDLAEDAFSLAEAAATEGIRSPVDDRSWPIPPRARKDIAGWIALQYLRGPWLRQVSRKLADEFYSLGTPARTGTGQQPAPTSSKNIDDNTLLQLQLTIIQQNLARIAAMLCEKDWILGFYQRKRLATSDTPIILIPAEDQPDFLGVGIENAAEIHVPLDRRVGLAIGDAGTGDGRLNGSAKTALFINHAMLLNARRYIFHHPEDDPLKGLQFPELRTRELVNPLDVSLEEPGPDRQPP